MRILVLNHNLRERGTWQRAWRLARELGLRGHRVALWTAAPHHFYRSERHRHPEADGGVLEVETPSWAPLAGGDDGWGPLDVAWRAAHLLTEPFDLCYAFAHPPNIWLPAWLASRLRGKPVLYDWCDWYGGGVFPKREELRRKATAPPREPFFQQRAERIEIGLEKRMLKLAGRVTVISELLKQLAIDGGRAENEIMLLPNGANLTGIVPQTRLEARHGWNLGEIEGPIIGYIANYHPDQELLLGAVARAARDIPNLRLLAAGADFDQDLVDRLGLRDRVKHHGRIHAERIQLLLGAADALVLPLEDHPNDWARVPFKFTDYLAAGRPIATSPIGDLAKWFAPGAEKIGAAAPPTVDGLGGALAAILTAPQAERDAMGRAARALAEREFAWPKLAERLESFIGEWLA